MKPQSIQDYEDIERKTKELARREKQLAAEALTTPVIEVFRGPAASRPRFGKAPDRVPLPGRHW